MKGGMVKYIEQSLGEPTLRRGWSAGTCSIIAASVRFYLKSNGKPWRGLTQRVT